MLFSIATVLQNTGSVADSENGKLPVARFSEAFKTNVELIPENGNDFYCFDTVLWFDD
jgi:hypothetical protein